jgi:hypothetical protein
MIAKNVVMFAVWTESVSTVEVLQIFKLYLGVKLIEGFGENNTDIFQENYLSLMYSCEIESERCFGKFHDLKTARNKFASFL